MEQLRLSPDFEQWLANIVDALNYDIGLINVAAGSLTTNLTTIDTPPISALSELVKSINQRFDKIDQAIARMQSNGV